MRFPAGAAHLADAAHNSPEFRLVEIRREEGAVDGGCGDDRGPPGRPGRMPMIPGSFAYHRPASVKEALGLLAQLAAEGRGVPGGHSLIPMMKLRLASPAHLVDLGGVADLKGIRSDGGDIVIGAMTTPPQLGGSE